jgi:hypothetical protein
VPKHLQVTNQDSTPEDNFSKELTEHPTPGSHRERQNSLLNQQKEQMLSMRYPLSIVARTRANNIKSVFSEEDNSQLWPSLFLTIPKSTHRPVPGPQHTPPEEM